tara:strand:+ start:5099 stop:5548 length:450 start_codon:yes stop_codon:yes gene_type:complete
MKSIAYTNINLMLFTSSFNFPYLYPYVVCSTWGIFNSFNFTYILNPKAMEKFNKKFNNQLLLGNIITHFIPICITLYLPPKSIKFRHGIISSCSHLMWGLYVSNGSLCCDKIYFQLPKKNWYFLWSIALISELLTPSLMRKYKKIIKSV